MTNIERTVEKFNELPAYVKLTVDSEVIKSKITFLNKKYKVNLFVLLFFIVTNELDYDGIENYIVNEFEKEPEEAKIIADEFRESVLSCLEKRLRFLLPDPEKNEIKNGEIKNIILGILNKDLINEINNPNEILDEINFQILLVLTEDQSFVNKAEKELYQNQERLTNKKFSLEEKPKSPTVSNWLKDFIKQNGTVMFDNIVLMKYMTESENAKKLDKDEKDLLKKLLLLYRNIKFFPESMLSDNVDDWEIFPVEYGSNDSITFSNVKSEEEKKINELKKEKLNYEQGTLESEVINEEITYKKEIEGLKIMLKKYKPGTLEYSAIFEEIKKKETEA
ncbi:hypothetical protein KAI92_02055 [Candidatus Parcubacteria bacterium]|nr:hypothetical protein [Candidatus Parcubacteria bacterium]